MTAVIRVYGAESSHSWHVLEQVCREANGLQTHFRFDISSLPALDRLPPGKLPIDEFEGELAGAVPPTSGVLFVDRTFTQKCVDERLPARIYVSCALKTTLTTPPLRLFALHQLASAALGIGTEIGAELNEQMTHKPAIGCLWDWWNGPEQLSVAVIVARICPQCHAILQRNIRDPEESIAACLQILDYVRRSMLGQSPALATRIFIAHGNSDDWRTLKSMLESWGLDIEHFNREPVAGVAAFERWRSMLDSSRFAFALMTPDDVGADGARRARQNVIHEIGLCHARLGLRNTAILLANGTERFSNVDGIQHIAFEPAHLAKKEGEIRTLLEDRGLLVRQSES